MPDHPPAQRSLHRFLRRPLLWVLALLLAFLGYFGWKDYDHRAAVREAKALGWTWEETSALALIRKDWHNAFEADTWEHHPRSIGILETEDLTPYRDLLRRLRPEKVSFDSCRNMDAFQGIDSIEQMIIFNPIGFQNLAMLKGLTELRKLQILKTPDLRSLDGVYQCPKLREVWICDCVNLQNIDALAFLPELQSVLLTNCPALQNLDALKNSSSLKELQIDRCPQTETAGALRLLTQLKVLALPSLLPDDTLREIRAVLPETQVLKQIPPL